MFVFCLYFSKIREILFLVVLEGNVIFILDFEFGNFINYFVWESRLFSLEFGFIVKMVLYL